MGDVREKVEEALRHFAMLKKGEGVVVAVSGGPDSVTLLSILADLQPEWNLTLVVAHVDHGLRGKESHADQELVLNLARRWGLICEVRELSPGERKKGLQVWGRQERYQFFGEVMARYGLSKTALGHTLDDQAETLLLRLIRGTGRRGLGGIAPIKEGWIIRPLITSSREEVLAYLETKGLPFARDRTNQDLMYTRNRVRHLLLPFLENEFNPQIRHRLAAFADLYREEETFLTGFIRRCLHEAERADHCLLFPRLPWGSPALLRRLLKTWLQERGGTDIGFSQVSRFIAFLMKGPTTGCITLSHGLTVVREYDVLRVQREKEGPVMPYVYKLIPGTEVSVEEIGWRIRLTPPFSWQGANFSSPSLWAAVFDADQLPAELAVRSFRVGDRIRSLGLCGHKKIKDIFIDAKVPLRLRRRFPLVEAEREIVWVPGLARSEKGKVTAETRRVVRAEARDVAGRVPMW